MHAASVLAQRGVMGEGGQRCRTCRHAMCREREHDDNQALYHASLPEEKRTPFGAFEPFGFAHCLVPCFPGFLSPEEKRTPFGAFEPFGFAHCLVPCFPGFLSWP